MTSRRRPPATAAGQYVLHDFRRIDWETWQNIPSDRQQDILDETVSFLEREAAVEEGGLGVFSVLGHKADLLILALRETMAALDTFERRFEQLALARHTARTSSAIGATEASGYTEGAQAYFDPEAEADPGLSRYMETRLYPEIPDAEFVSFYFMDKRRGAEHNWYDLSYEERAAHVTQHGEIGREFAGRVTQMITGTIGFDDWEWGVTLFANDMIAIKDLLTAMRFDPSTSRYAAFGRFYVGRRFPPTDLAAFLAGEPIPTSEPATASTDSSVDTALKAVSESVELPDGSTVVIVRSHDEVDAVVEELSSMRDQFDHYDSHLFTEATSQGGETLVVSAWTTDRAAGTAQGFLEELPGVHEARRGSTTGDDGAGAPTAVVEDEATAEDVRSALADSGVHTGQPHGEDIHAVVVYSAADRETVRKSVASLVSAFEADADHEGTDIYAARHSDRAAIASLWATPAGAEGAAERMAEIPGLERPSDEDGFTTMGLFYRVKPDHREAFVDTFENVTDALADMDGHRRTELLVNLADEHDMFIASRWRGKEDAMAFFRSDAFRDTVAFGRDVLADRPRHVFLT